MYSRRLKEILIRNSDFFGVSSARPSHTYLASLDLIRLNSEDYSGRRLPILSITCDTDFQMRDFFCTCTPNLRQPLLLCFMTVSSLLFVNENPSPPPKRRTRSSTLKQRLPPTFEVHDRLKVLHSAFILQTYMEANMLGKIVTFAQVMADFESESPQTRNWYMELAKMRLYLLRLKLPRTSDDPLPPFWFGSLSFPPETWPALQNILIQANCPMEGSFDLPFLVCDIDSNQSSP
ncbi:hypothetical protein EDD86DRAFT_107978 [Gorgonomyces haynaldii]|nr:hypothetical protein EDD86DRAFT_107978 [Gorgonomyces haynaldii]